MSRNGDERNRKETVSAVCEPSWRGAIPRAKEGTVKIRAVMEWTEKKINGKWKVVNKPRALKIVSCPFLKSGRDCSNFNKDAFEDIKKQRRKLNENVPRKMKTPVNHWPECPVMSKFPGKGLPTISFKTSITNKNLGTYHSG